MQGAPRILLVIAIVFLAGTLHAQTVSWTYVQGGFMTLDPDVGGAAVSRSTGTARLPVA